MLKNHRKYVMLFFDKVMITKDNCIIKYKVLITIYTYSINVGKNWQSDDKMIEFYVKLREEILCK